MKPYFTLQLPVLPPGEAPPLFCPWCGASAVQKGVHVVQYACAKGDGPSDAGYVHVDGMMWCPDAYRGCPNPRTEAVLAVLGLQRSDVAPTGTPLATYAPGILCAIRDIVTHTLSTVPEPKPTAVEALLAIRQLTERAYLWEDSVRPAKP